MVTAHGMVVVVENNVVSIFYAGKNWRPEPIRADTGL